MNTVCIVHYGEIGLKGKNRPLFENQLIKNIQDMCVREGLDKPKIAKNMKRFVVDSADERLSSILSQVFGVKNFSFAESTDVSLDAALALARKKLELFVKEGAKKVSFETKRSNKKFPVNSLELHKQFGAIANELGLKVDYKHTDHCLFTEVTDSAIFMYTEKHRGPGGLPVGTAGKVLIMFSGGIDSAVIPFLLMKRGCKVDFVHFHMLTPMQNIEDTKIYSLIQAASKLQGNATLHLVPYHEYQLQTTGTFKQGLDLAAFKHFMFLAAQEIARKGKYKALATGDNIAQVASQTLQNIESTRMNISTPIFSPLITFDKEEIIDLAKHYSVYDLAIQKYQDCCSIMSKNPYTHVKRDELAEALEKVDLAEILSRTLEQSSRITIPL